MWFIAHKHILIYAQVHSILYVYLCALTGEGRDKY